MKYSKACFWSIFSYFCLLIDQASAQNNLRRKDTGKKQLLPFLSNEVRSPRRHTWFLNAFEIPSGVLLLPAPSGRG